MSRPASQPAWRSLRDSGLSDATSTSKPKRQLIHLPGGNKALGAFFLSLVAYTLQTECAQYVQQALNYRKPFLSLYLGHSGFSVLLPLHLAVLCYTTHYPLSHYLHLISQNLRWQLRTPSAPLPRQGPDAVRRRLSQASGRGVEHDAAGQWNHVDLEDGEPSKRRTGAGFGGKWVEDRVGFNAFKLFGLIGILTLGITVPALSWYSAVPMTSMADITAIYNTFSVWALVFSVWFLGEKWEKRKVFSVLLACIGVIIVAYGGADHRKQPKEVDPVYGAPSDDVPGNATVGAAGSLVTRAVAVTIQDLLRRTEDGGEPAPPSFSNPMLGDFLAFIGAVTMAAYEMAFKVIGTLPDEAKQRDLYSAVGSAGRRPYSYVEYRDGDHEGQGLLSEAHGHDEFDDGAPRDPDACEPVQHVLGTDDDEDSHQDGDGGRERRLKDPDAGSGARLASIRAGERASIWNRPSLGEGDPYSYQTMTPPPELAVDGDTSSKKMGSRGDGVTVQARPVGGGGGGGDDDDDVTESEMDEGEAEEVEHGAHRLRRNPSYASTKRQSQLERAAAEVGSGGGCGEASTYYRSASAIHGDTSIPPPLPFGLHANLMTSGIGLVTLTCLWIGIPVAHVLGWEQFELPANWWTVFSLGVVVTCGVFFNAAFMILLSLWGPVLASVSCLMTTVLVEVADVVLGREVKVASVVGCSLVGAGFGVLISGGGEGLH
ncbi:hypothetical protein ACQY0O_004676 [Thecaphora frezii]